MEVELGTVVNRKTVVHQRSASRMSPEQAAGAEEILTKLTFQSRRQIPASSRTPARMEPTKIHRETLKSSVLPPSGEMKSSICGDQKVSQQMLFHCRSS